MSTRAYATLSGMCITGAVALAILDKDAAQVAALLGLAGTLAGRGKGSDA